MDSDVLVPLATAIAVEAVVEIPGMAAVRKAIPVIVDTWVDTTVLRPKKSPLSVDNEVLVPLATARAVDAVVEIPGMDAVAKATPEIVDT